MPSLNTYKFTLLFTLNCIAGFTSGYFFLVCCNIEVFSRLTGIVILVPP